MLLSFFLSLFFLRLTARADESFIVAHVIPVEVLHRVGYTSAFIGRNPYRRRRKPVRHVPQGFAVGPAYLPNGQTAPVSGVFRRQVSAAGSVGSCSTTSSDPGLISLRSDTWSEATASLRISFRVIARKLGRLRCIYGTSIHREASRFHYTQNSTQQRKLSRTISPFCHRAPDDDVDAIRSARNAISLIGSV